MTRPATAHTTHAAPRVERLLDAARAGIERLTPAEAHARLAEGAVLVDIRSDTQRAADGEIPRAVVICRNVLEWRCDPTSPWREDRTSDPDRQLIVVCNEGYQSSFAAAVLRELGHARAADVVGGFRAWRSAGLPVAAAAGVSESEQFLPRTRG